MPDILAKLNINGTNDPADQGEIPIWQETSSADWNPIWIGVIPGKKVAKWIDSMIMLIFGGLPWQAYFQRVLSADNDRSAQVLSFAAPAGCVLLVIPPILIGAAAKVVDWTATDLPTKILETITSSNDSLLMSHIL